MSSDIVNILEGCINKVIRIRLRNNRMIRGTLQTFDIYMNLTLSKSEDITDDEAENLDHILLRGDNIIAVYLPDN
ncbi:MAG: putative snRNP Sm-like protein [Nitrosopumilales archaeon]|nr:MAG: putative snRNP Sm-like protein [Nitrosopumilales archaeon]